jgi:hypothetical protein
MDINNSTTWIYPNFGVKYLPKLMKNGFDTLSDELSEVCEYVDYSSFWSANAD